MFIDKYTTEQLQVLNDQEDRDELQESQTIPSQKDRVSMISLDS